MNKKKVLVGSPIYQKAEILKVFLESLKKLSRDSVSLDYMFVDDNEDLLSSDILSKFNRIDSKVVIIKGNESGVYVCNSSSHEWNDNLMLKVANYKNLIIDHAIKNDYDYLFFVDSDLILHPNIIEHLKSKDKEILSEIFWTKWHENMSLEPNVWLFDEYDLVPKELGEILSEETMNIRKMNFLNQLKVEGVYEVGGLGACTLISKNALLKGVNFKSIKNLTIHGEDRFFCIRAAVLGIELFVDTFYPAYHIYRESDLSGVDYYNQNNKKKQNNKITLSMIVKNEENRYLEELNL